MYGSHYMDALLRNCLPYAIHNSPPVETRLVRVSEFVFREAYALVTRQPRVRRPELGRHLVVRVATLSDLRYSKRVPARNKPAHTVKTLLRPVRSREKVEDQTVVDMDLVSRALQPVHAVKDYRNCRLRVARSLRPRRRRLQRRRRREAEVPYGHVREIAPFRAVQKHLQTPGKLRVDPGERVSPVVLESYFHMRYNV